MTLWGNDAVGVWVKMHTPVRAAFSRKIVRWEDWELEALMWPDEVHPSHAPEIGVDMSHLVRVQYIYLGFNGWIRKDRVRPR